MDTKNAEELWKHGKSVLGYQQPGPPTTIKTDVILTSDPQVIADVMNKAFIDKIARHKESIPATDQDPCQYTKELTESSGVVNGNIKMPWHHEVHESIVEKAIKLLSKG